MIHKSFSEADTFSVAEQLGAAAKPGEVYYLSGELGAGKTVFAKGFAKGLGVAEEITSPTFCIVNEYSGTLPLYHFDVYRINSLDEMEDIGYTEYFNGGGVCLVEWGELISGILPADTKFVKITKDCENADYRRIEIQ